MKICLKFLAVTILDIDAYMIIVYIQLNQQPRLKPEHTTDEPRSQQQINLISQKMRLILIT